MLLVAPVSLCTPRARAQASDGPSAAANEYGAAIDEAVAAFQAGRWLEARAAFARAHAIDPSARTFRGLGLASFYLNEHGAARAAFEAALSDTRKPLTDVQRSELTSMLEQSARASGRYSLELTPPDAKVMLDGAAVADSILFLDLGEHALVVDAPGYVRHEQAITVRGGEDSSLQIVLARAALEPPEQPEPIVLQPKTTQVLDPPAVERSRERLWTWIALGAVPVFASTAAVVWFSGQAERDDVDRQCRALKCDPSQARALEGDAHLDAYETWTTVSLGAAALSLVGAGVLFFVEGEVAVEDAPLSFGREGAVLKARL